MWKNRPAFLLHLAGVEKAYQGFAVGQAGGKRRAYARVVDEAGGFHEKLNVRLHEGLDVVVAQSGSGYGQQPFQTENLRRPDDEGTGMDDGRHDELACIQPVHQNALGRMLRRQGAHAGAAAVGGFQNAAPGKGAQGGKRSMDRASGSGVFARDADALLDMIQLETDQVGLPGTAWRIEGTLREFKAFEPLNLWFEYPVHKIDDTGFLAELRPNAEKAPWEKSKETKKEAKKKQMESAYNACSIKGDVTVADMANYLDTTERTVRRYIKEGNEFEYCDGKVVRKEEKS